MPIYEYQCSSCNHKLEIIQKMSEPPLTDCPNCDKNTLTKLISASRFELKGTGWYVTDFKNKETKSNVAATPNTDTSKKEAANANSSTKESTPTSSDSKSSDSN